MEEIKAKQTLTNCRDDRPFDERIQTIAAKK